MGHPDVPLQYCPVPNTTQVTFLTTLTIAPQVKHELGEVDYRLVHDITREAGWGFQNVRDATEYAGFPDTGLESLLLVLGVVLRSHDTSEVVLVFSGVHWREIGDVDIRVVV